MLSAKAASPKPPRATKSPSPDASPVHVGDNVRIKSTQTWGKVAFIGATEFAKGVWAGVELAQVGMGKNDGSVNNVRYFECADKTGVFVRPDALEVVELGEDGKPISKPTKPRASSVTKSAPKTAVKSVVASAATTKAPIRPKAATPTAPPKATTPTGGPKATTSSASKPPVSAPRSPAKTVRRVPSSATNGSATPKARDTVDVTAIEKRIKELEAENESLKAQVAEKKPIDTPSEEATRSLPSDHPAPSSDDLHNQLTEARASLEHARAEWSAREAELERKLLAAADRSALEQSADDYREKDNTLVADSLLEAQNALTELQGKYDSLVEEKNAAEEKGRFVEDLEGKIRELESQAGEREMPEDKTAELEATKARVAELEAAAAEREAAQAKVVELEAKVEALQAQVEAAAEAKDIAGQHETLKVQYIELQDAHRQLNDKFDELAGEVEKAREGVAAAKEGVTEVEVAAVRAQYEEEIKKLGEALKEKEWFASNLEGQIEELQLHLGKSGDKVTELEALLSEKDTKIVSLEEDLQTTRSITPAAPAAEDTEELRIQLEEKSTLVQTLQIQLSDLLSQNATLTERAAQQIPAPSTDESDAKIASLESEIQTLHSTIESLKTDLQTAKHHESDALSLIEHSRHEYEAAVAHFAELESEKKGLEEKLVEKELEIQRLKEVAEGAKQDARGEEVVEVEEIVEILEPEDFKVADVKEAQAKEEKEAVDGHAPVETKPEVQA
ncbi:Kinesin protein 1B [Rhizophlyctis rosea]|uniref:Kinesin protein 1B n=1 Tax=Rhizophlyctis rosea TaxID=64517 RepID=A0AAD5S8X2_9FUNG|nr:Kinesin protein 1B [Rhizophlyctis rosea]